MSTSGMHRRPFEGRHLVIILIYFYFRCRRPVDGGEWHAHMKDMDENTLLPYIERDDVAESNVDDLVSSSAALDDDDNNDDEDADPDDPLWQLFLTAKNLTVPSSEFFFSY